jgi:hypothetical protein
VLPKLVQIALCMIEIRAARLIYIIIRYETFLCISLPPLFHMVVLLDHLMVLYFLVWVELVVAVLVLGLITVVLCVCCCISGILNAKRISCFSLLR